MISLEAFVAGEYENMLATLVELTELAAPTHHEEVRAEYIKRWLKKNGADTAYIDEAKNVVFELGSGNSTLFSAHIDTVFDENVPLDVTKEGNIYKAPGIGDNTANAVVLMYALKYLLVTGLVPSGGAVFAFNSCEEGFGNLYGINTLMQHFGDTLSSVITFDLYLGDIYAYAVGSERYRIFAETEGGHSYLDFGKENAISVLAEFVRECVGTPLPTEGKTTYNFGTISGGRSINVIASQAELTYEFRSDKKENLDYMRSRLSEILSHNKALKSELLGLRPCQAVDKEKQDSLLKRVRSVYERRMAEAPQLKSSSTDSNAPLSLGIPSLCLGTVTGGDLHTTEEWVNVSSLQEGLALAVDIVCSISNAK